MAPTPVARAAFAAVALAGAGGLALSLVLTLADPSGRPPAEPGLFGPGDVAGRVADWLGYFTHWSAALVVVVFGRMALRPRPPSRGFRVLLLDALLMITVTGIVYALILAPAAPPMDAAEALANGLLHYVTPPLALLAFAIVGPRDWLERRLIPAALAIPIIWIALTLVRGAIIDAYPYGFINVVALGYPMALVNTLVIVAFGIAICFALIGLDRLARRWAPAADRPRPAGAAKERA